MRNILRIVILALSVGIAVAPSVRADPIITDGGFVSGGTYWSASNVDFASHYGATYAVFGSNLGSLSQSFQTVTGTNYRLTATVGAFFTGTGDEPLGGTMGLIDFMLTIGNDNPMQSVNVLSGQGVQYGITSVSFEFTGQSDFTQLTIFNAVFDTTDDPAVFANGGVTNIVVTDIPEPMSIVIMGSCLAGLAFVRMRKRI